MEKSSKTRKAHKKSRNGCLPCKLRHVKCDEVKPACVNCDKYGSKCEYPLPKKRISTEQSASTPSSVDGFNNSSEFHGSQIPFSTLPEQALNMSHLRLLHHFTTVTARTLVADPGAEEVYHSYMIHVALEFPFLMQAVLALASLHLSRLNSTLNEHYMRLAETHHNAALTQFRNEVQDIDETNFQAVLCFAALLFPYSCAFPIDLQNSPENMLDGLFQMLALTRRVRPMVQGFYKAMLNSELGRLVPPDTRNISFEPENRPLDTELVTLRKFAEAIQQVYPPDINEAYGEAIRYLEIVFERAASSNSPPSDGLLKVWIHTVTPRFMNLLFERSPGALVIFAHYAVLFSRSRHYWYLEGVAEQMLLAADILVPGEWKAWLDWPKAQIGAINPQTVPPSI
ncbi:hypothetical protein B0J11DRAFT_268343 [Dendryphion nanum]|uniref:Zn(2)-C6 fungal-type domain-containing protein n=1 Tax=Dendryphion nanum TaxID=256645 RepID=A0A9P9IMU3_9PLEO|nr:hypothetical protein B0J11DRAFT_268343 [Dendryphion nanum]